MNDKIKRGAPKPPPTYGNGRPFPPSDGRKPPEPTPMMLVNEVSKLFKNILVRENENLQSSYRHLLFHLAHEDGVTQLRLAKLTHLKPPTVSVTLQKMERDGYVVRRQDENDLRQTLVYLTDKGREHNERIWQKIGEIDKKVMEGIAPEDVETVKRVLAQMRNNIFEEGRDERCREID